MRDGFIFYESFWNAIQGLPAQTQLLLYNALAGYALCDTEPNFGEDAIAKGFFTLMRPQIDANNRRREAGLRGGRPKKSAEQEPLDYRDETKRKPNDNQTVTKAEPKEKEKEKDKENVKGKGSRIDKLSNKDMEDLNSFMIEHCKEENISTIEIDKFIDYWKSTTKNAIKLDWKATFRNHCRQDWVKKVNAYEVTGYE